MVACKATATFQVRDDGELEDALAGVLGKERCARISRLTRSVGHVVHEWHAAALQDRHSSSRYA
eukprot:1140641-Pelagomonas_calceolata.AAC.4